MVKEKRNFFRDMCLMVVFLLGNLVIVFPKGVGSKYSLFGYLLCIAISFLMCLIYIPLQNRQLNEKTFRTFSKYNTINVVIAFAVIVFAFLCFSFCIKDYIHMVNTVRLQQTPNIIIAIVFISLSVWLGTCKKQGIIAIAALSFLFICFAVVLMFFLSIDSFDRFFLKDAVDFNSSYTVKQAISLYLQSFGQIILVLIFLGEKNRKAAKKLQLSGVAIGGLIFAICLINTVALIGVKIINRIEFPYATATAAINSSRDYTRMDIMTYYIFFVTSLIKSAVIYKVSVNIARSFSTIAKNLTSVILPIGAFLISSSRNLTVFFDGDIIPLILLALEIILPLLLICGLNRRNHCSL